jgi:hypothetical protein
MPSRSWCPSSRTPPDDAKTRDAWLERLFEAYQDNGIPYIEWLGEHWGTLCASQEVASTWADRLIDTVKLAWGPDLNQRVFFKGTTNCLSTLVAAERYDDVLLSSGLVEEWYRRYGLEANQAGTYLAMEAVLQ